MSTRLEQLVDELTLSLKVIQKWHGVAFEKKKDMANIDCVFCRAYRGLDFERDCRSCPIVKYKLGSKYCKDTVYVFWEKRTEFPRIADTPERQHLAVKELLFLIKVADHICGLIGKEIRK